MTNDNENKEANGMQTEVKQIVKIVVKEKDYLERFFQRARGAPLSGELCFITFYHERFAQMGEYTVGENQVGVVETWENSYYFDENGLTQMIDFLQIQRDRVRVLRAKSQTPPDQKPEGEKEFDISALKGKEPEQDRKSKRRERAEERHKEKKKGKK